jgi:ribose transport system ATP-binding protein
VSPLPRLEGASATNGAVPSEAPALAVHELSKTFAGGRALDGVSFALERGRVHALIGGNGSGKSTLVKCLAGIQPADPGGEVVVGDERIAGDDISPSWARANGLRFVHQNPGMFPTLTVQENCALGHGYPTTVSKIRWGALEARTQKLLDRFHVAAKPGQLLADLRPADRAMIAIARAMQDRYDDDADPDAVSTLILDEPTASLPEDEVELLLTAIRRYADDGLAIVFITHRLEEVVTISDTVTVLRDGRLVTSRTAQGLREDDLVRFIVGDALEELERVDASSRRLGDVVASLAGVTAGPLRDVSFSVRAGEILGLAGLLGSGRTELLQTLFGSLKVQSGRIAVHGEEVTFANPAQAMARGVAFVPEDRADSIFASMAVRENFSAPSMKRYARMLVNRRREKAETKASLRAFRVKSDGIETPISTLSGGNQQKVVLARWLHRKPGLLLLDEPTQGVDVGARADAYAIIREAAESGMAVIVVSSDFEELADLSDRVLVLTSGRVTAELRGAEVTRNNLTERVLIGKGQQTR